jgi:ketosteroid isomerase-like protein
MATKSELVTGFYEAFHARDRETFEAAMADDFLFSSPDDPRLDKQGYFERCWPNGGQLKEFRIDRLVENGDEVFVRYEATNATGKRFRNTELIRLDGDRIKEVQVYYGAYA